VPTCLMAGMDLRRRGRPTRFTVYYHDRDWASDQPLGILCAGRHWRKYGSDQLKLSLICQILVLLGPLQGKADFKLCSLQVICSNSRFVTVVARSQSSMRGSAYLPRSSMRSGASRSSLGNDTLRAWYRECEARSIPSCVNVPW
jgi:hypothetical protein